MTERYSPEGMRNETSVRAATLCGPVPKRLLTCSSMTAERRFISRLPTPAAPALPAREQSAWALVRMRVPHP